MGGVGSEASDGGGERERSTGAGDEAMRDWRERQAPMMLPNDDCGVDRVGGLAGGEAKWAG